VIAARIENHALKPPLKWAGGKRWLVPHLLPLWEPHCHRRLVEPFCGGLAVTLGLMPRKALLNDVNPHVVNFYEWLQRGLKIDIPLKNELTTYYRYREEFNCLIREGRANSSQAAALFYYLNRTCFNGLCRFNQKGEFNVPLGRYKTINYTMDFSEYQAVLLRWRFQYADFVQIPLEPDDFLYADPPYDVKFVQYTKHGFSWDDQVRLAEWLARHSGPVIVSNQATERIVDLYRSLGFALKFLDAPRMISSDGNRRPAREVLAVKHLLM
jgi:DNA adenine methylase